MTRRATEDFVLRDTLIPRGTMIRLTPWAIQRDPRHWPDPAAFRPERFLPGAPAPGRGAWLPFGTGPRVCIGQHFAMTEILLVGALLLQRMDWSLAPGSAPSRPEMNVTLRDAGGLQVRLRRRAREDAPAQDTSGATRR
jgi:cytochrome P450